MAIGISGQTGVAKLDAQCRTAVAAGQASALGAPWPTDRSPTDLASTCSAGNTQPALACHIVCVATADTTHTTRLWP
jgi:hypothetical protein